MYDLLDASYLRLHQHDRIGATSYTGRLMFGIFTTLAEFERDLILERTMAGPAGAHTRGRPAFGRG